MLLNASSVSGPLVLAAALLLSTGAAAKDQSPTEPDERDKRDSIEAIIKEPVPEFDKSSARPWVIPNIRLTGAGGVFQLQNNADVSLSGAHLGASAEIGDTYFGFIGYYVPVRVGLFSFDSVKKGSAIVDNFNDKQGVYLQAGAGLELWVWPEHLGLMVEGVYAVTSFATQPVLRDDFALVSDAGGPAVRARVLGQIIGIGVFVEAEQQLAGIDFATGDVWGGTLISAGLSYQIGDTFGSWATRKR